MIAAVRERLKLVLVTDRRKPRDGDLGAAVDRALRGGVTAVMLREKDLATDELVALGVRLAAACRAAGAAFIVNGDLAAARALRADGVHLGYGAASVAEARAALGSEILVGRSTHDLSELSDAARAGACYVTFGPVWDTPSKRGLLEPRGTAALTDAVRACGVPVVALGGVNASRAADVRRTGAAGIACIGAILDAADESAAATEILRAWDEAR